MCDLQEGLTRSIILNSIDRIICLYVYTIEKATYHKPVVLIQCQLVENVWLFKLISKVDKKIRKSGSGWFIKNQSRDICIINSLDKVRSITWPQNITIIVPYLKSFNNCQEATINICYSRFHIKFLLELSFWKIKPLDIISLSSWNSAEFWLHKYHNAKLYSQLKYDIWDQNNEELVL